MAQVNEGNYEAADQVARRAVTPVVRSLEANVLREIIKESTKPG